LVLNQYLLAGAIALDSSFALTHGSPHSLWWMTAQFDPRQSVLSRLYQDEDLERICQLRISSNEQLAKLSFLSANSIIRNQDLSIILDDMRQCAQNFGALHLIAEVDHKQPLLESMKAWGFGVCAWQDIWKLERPIRTSDPLENKIEWCPLAEVDWWQTSQLLQSIIPPISQTTDLPLRHRSRFWVCHHADRIIAFADIRQGPQGIWIQPTFDPEISRVPDLICELVNVMPARLSRPLYLSIRSYQSWLFRSIELMNAEYLGHQAILVKHLVGYIKEFSPAELLRFDKTGVKPSHTVIPSHSTKWFLH
jgi:hypothetical protein